MVYIVSLVFKKRQLQKIIAERSVATFAKTSAWKITTTWLRDDSAFSFPNGRRQKGVWIYQLCQGTQ